ncbi:MAG: alanyl-tRNA editing protein [Anaerolineae bacterium]|nr:alanyl-tRNA editing protein [Anaerolineae bacterium]
MRAYYDDSYATTFTARVLERLEVEGRPAVVLDRTFFYPTGGGQPNDLGTISGCEVIDVQSRKADNAVLHVLVQSPGADEAECQVDWRRRFDHMQHHTGQHVLSQAFVLVAAANTVGFHLSPDSVTIDLDRPDLNEGEIERAEDEANRIVFEDRSILTRLVEPDQAEGVRMRRVPEARATGGLRVVEIQDFDLTACGGTHVARTGEIGIIKIVRVEKRGDKLRVEFRCGGRALRDYRERTRVTNLLAADLTCPLAEMPEAVARLRSESKDSQRRLKAVQSELLAAESLSLLMNAEVVDQVRWVVAVFADRDVGALRALASRLVQEPGVAALLGSAGERSALVLARSADLPIDMAQAFRAAADGGLWLRGGGQSALAQGGGGACTREEMSQALAAARNASSL